MGTWKGLFSANDGTHGTELFITNGTAVGTSLVDDVYAGLDGSYPDALTPLFNGTAVFAATDNPDGPRLWVTDGTAAGTALVIDVNVQLVGTSPIVPIGNGEAVFSGNNGTGGFQPWVTDGTAGGTSILSTAPGPAGALVGGINPSEFTPPRQRPGAVPCQPAHEWESALGDGRHLRRYLRDHGL